MKETSRSKRTVQLLNWRPKDPSPYETLGAACVAPSFLPWMVGVFAFLPIVLINRHQHANYSEVMENLLPECWLTLLLLFLLSLVCTWLVARWAKEILPREYGTLVRNRIPLHLARAAGLLGDASATGDGRVWGMSGRGCRVIGDACASCATVFAEPERLGTEIFA